MKRQNLNILLLGLILMLSSGCNRINSTPPTETEVKTAIQAWHEKLEKPHKVEIEFSQITISSQKNANGYFEVKAPRKFRVVDDGGKILEENKKESVTYFYKVIKGDWKFTETESIYDLY